MNKLAIVLALSTAASLAACGGSSSSSSATEPAPTGAMAEARADVVDTAIAAGSFKTLVAAVQAADLVDTLRGPGPFTVFAPTDEAFAKLPPGTVDALLKDKAALTAVLTYHVVAGRVTAAEVAGMRQATTVQGGTIAIDASSGVMINDASVVTADVMASNGVIHVIDSVLMPPM